MSISGKVVAFSGTLSIKRADAKSQAEAAGATVGSSVTNKTDILVAASDVAGKKISDAQAKGVEIWTEDDFLAACSGKKGGKGKKKAAAPDPAPSAAPSKKKAKTTPSSTVAGLSGMAAPAFAGGADDDSDKDGEDVLDEGLAAVNSTLAANGALMVGADGSPMVAKLAQVNVASNTDKYYVLQLIDGGGGSYYVYSRWGRTGTSGQSRLEGPHDVDTAVKAFDKIYKSKAGVTWERRKVGGAPKAGSYQHLAMGSSKSGPKGTWEYFLTSDPMGKPDGWYPYDAKAGEQVEDLYRDHESNPSTMAVRFVFAESSGFMYRVDLVASQQTNTNTNKARPIRRIAPPGEAAASSSSSSSSTTGGSGRSKRSSKAAASK